MTTEKKPNIIKRFWKWFRSPSKIAVGTLLVVAFIAGIV